MPRKSTTAAEARTAPGPYVFISHDSRDAELAALFSDLVRVVTANMIRCFRSSDSQGTEGIAFGDEWYGKVVDALDAASDVVCLLTPRSLERPWILFEAGMARGMRHHRPVFGLLLGIGDVGTSPFAQFQNCAATADAVEKLLTQLCAPHPQLRPDPQALSGQVRLFLDRVGAELQRLPASRRRVWRRRVPLHAEAEVLLAVTERLEQLRADVLAYMRDQGRDCRLDGIRANLLLPDDEFRDKGEFPGQLYFYAAVPAGGFKSRELGLRFAPGEGVAGKVFLDDRAFVEHRAFGVSSAKLSVMPGGLSAVAGFPLLHRDMSASFGVVCVDLIDTEVTQADLDGLLESDAVKDRVDDMARYLLDAQPTNAFLLEFSARPA